MNETEFDAAMVKLEEEYSRADRENSYNYFGRQDTITLDDYLKKWNNNLNDFKKTKHRLYEERADAKIIANRFSNETDTLTVRGLVKILERYENELLDANQQMSINVAESLTKPGGHYHTGVASTLGTMFGMLISFLVFIIIKKFKHRNDPMQQPLI